MTGGGVMQVVSYGAQDIYLTANPEVTFFKQVYRRHSNFAIESIEQTFNGVPTFAKRLTATIGRSGDLIHRIYLQATLPQVDLNNPAISSNPQDQFRWLNWVGHNLVSFVEVTIGGQKIDRQYGDWMHIWNELTLPPGKQSGYEEMVGNVPQLVNVISKVGSDGACQSAITSGTPPMSNEVMSCSPEYTLYIPLQFWFNRHAGLAIPLIALQNHDVQINMDINGIQNLCWSNNPSVIEAVNAIGLQAASLYIDYIFLDAEERRRFAQTSHEYLIEQLQFTGEESFVSNTGRVKMTFNHPVKELVWVVQRDSFVSIEPSIIDPWKGQQPFNYTDYWDTSVLDNGYSTGKLSGRAGNNPVAVAKIQLNGRDRFSEREGAYFNLVQPYQHHTNTPARGINVYSFCLNPEEHQPSGSCNFSRIDTAQLLMTLTPNAAGQGVTSKVRIYATNYNVLRVMSGMAGLAFSN
jgi:hypothetical protein